MIARCRHHGCRTEIVLDDKHAPPLCPEHGGGDVYARRDWDDRHRQEFRRWLDTLGDNPPPTAPPPPRGLASPGRRDALPDFWGDRG